MTFEPFDIVAVPFPFSDRQASKRRPALVVSSTAFNQAHRHLILTMITSAAGQPWASDVPVQDWADAGLSVACRVRLKLFTLDTALVVRRIGRLAPDDADRVQATLRRCLI
ncbi:MAG TPA: type II toxin-antitoxin system PemK/MazF family toxin [Pseudohaliea sp.]|nr:type II toxin-antitoxin system PemK/MazF family toxin [Pseudohaliea sp.]